jgi:hypothetical protein
LDAELTRHFKSLELKKKRNRRRYTRNFILVWSFVALFTAIAFLGNFYKSTFLYLLAAILAFFAGVAATFTSMNLLASIYSPLSDLDSAFVKVYKALETLELPPKKKDSQDEEDVEVEQHAYDLLQSSVNNLQTEYGKDALLKEADELADSVLEDVNTRLIPAAEEGNLSAKRVEEFAKLLASPTLEGLKVFGYNLKLDFPKPREIEEVSVRKTLAGFFGTRKGQVLLAFFYGYVLIFALAFVFATATQVDFLTFGRSNSGVLLTGGAIVSIGLLQFMKGSKTSG